MPRRPSVARYATTTPDCSGRRTRSPPTAGGAAGRTDTATDQRTSVGSDLCGCLGGERLGARFDATDTDEDKERWKKAGAEGKHTL